MIFFRAGDKRGKKRRTRILILIADIVLLIFLFAFGMQAFRDKNFFSAVKTENDIEYSLDATRMKDNKTLFIYLQIKNRSAENKYLMLNKFNSVVFKLNKREKIVWEKVIESKEMLILKENESFDFAARYVSEEKIEGIYSLEATVDLRSGPISIINRMEW